MIQQRDAQLSEVELWAKIAELTRDAEALRWTLPLDEPVSTRLPDEGDGRTWGDVLAVLEVGTDGALLHALVRRYNAEYRPSID